MSCRNCPATPHISHTLYISDGRTKIGGGWKALLKLSGSLVESANLPHVRLRYTAIRILCMLKLIVRNHSLLQHALNMLTEVGGPRAKQNQYQTYPELYPGRTGTMLPFMIRLLDCEANYILSKDLAPFFVLHTECLKTAKLNGGSAAHRPPLVLLDAEKVFSRPDSLLSDGAKGLFTEFDESKPELWYQRADEIAFSILTRQVQIREPFLGLQTISQLLPHYVTHPSVIAIIIRLYLLVGDVKAAKKALAKLESAATEPSADPVTVTLHRGLILSAESEYEQALAEFEKVLAKEQYHITAVNNAAICLTFLRNAGRAVTLLEDALFSKPESNLNETSIFNLCTIYEILSDKALDRRRKVLQLVLDSAPDHFNLLSLRLPPGSLVPTQHPPILP